MTAIAIPSASAPSSIAEISSGGVVDGRYRLLEAAEDDSPLPSARRWAAFDQRLNRKVDLTIVLADDDARPLQAILADDHGAAPVLDAGELDLGGARRIYLVCAATATTTPPASTPGRSAERSGRVGPKHAARVSTRRAAALRIRLTGTAEFAT